MDQQRTDISMLTDAELAEAAWQHRREALHGNRQAFGLAHECERELRRRAGIGLKDVTAEPAVGKGKPWWQVWSLRKDVSTRGLRA